MDKYLVVFFVLFFVSWGGTVLADTCPPQSGSGWTLICSGTNVCYNVPSELYCDSDGSRLTVTYLETGPRCAMHFPRPEAAAWCDGSQDADCDIVEPLNAYCEYGDEEEEEEPRIPWTPEIDIPLPGEDPMDSETTISDYVNRIYRFVIMILGILAAAMFMIGGFQYLTSAGNNAAVSEAKNTIMGAIAGMIIVLGSYLLLRIINQELVDLTDPSVLNFPKEASRVFWAILREINQSFIG